MGANAATKVDRMIDNLEKILAIEMMNATQALEFRKPLMSSTFITELITEYRKEVHFIENDEEMYSLIEKSIQFIRRYSFKIFNKITYFLIYSFFFLYIRGIY